MSKLRLLVVGTLANPMATNWVYGFKSLGYSVAVLDWRDFPATPAQLEEWGFQNDVKVFNCKDISDEVRQAVRTELDGEPAILFCFWGSQVLEPLSKAHQSFPRAKVVLCTETLPNASNFLTELREILLFRQSDSLINGYVFYSEAMRQLFCRRVPSARGKTYLAMIMPFLEKAFVRNDVISSDIPQLKRLDKYPHVIFTGRGDKLWTKDYKMAKDAVGSFLVKLAERGIHVFVSHSADLKGIPNLHPYPKFSNADLFGGRFGQYVSQFDAHLAIYNECNDTICRRVSTSLSTRLAFAFTSTSPVVVTQRSQFVKEYWGDTPFGFNFTSVNDLVASLHDQHLLTSLRLNMNKMHLSHSFESQSERVERFLQKITETL